MNYEELVKSLRICAKWPDSEVKFPGNSACIGCKYHDAEKDICLSWFPEKKNEKLLVEAADAIEELLQKTQQLEERLSGAVAFWDSVENNNIIMKLNPMFPDFISPAWQKAHKEMGFISPLADLYEELGVYDEPSKEGEE